MKNNTIIAGIDLSLTHTGYAILDGKGEVLTSGVIKSKPSGDKPVDETRRIAEIVENCMSTISNYVPEMVILENLAFMAQGTSLTQLAGLHHFTRILLEREHIPFILVAPTSLKKFVTGSGKGDKDQMQMVVYKEYGHESLDNNECDAYALAVCGLALLGKPVKKLIKPQEEVINLLKRQLCKTQK